MENYSFGKTIKELRHTKNITQSRLAELLSVSPQAISKWENDVGYPDFTLLAPLSDILGVSTDCLLGKNNNTKAEEIRAAKDRTKKLWQAEGNTNEECIKIWRELCRKYPADYECRNHLAFELSCAEKGEPYTEEKYREAAELYESVLDECTDKEIWDKALYLLVHLYGNKLNETELAIEYAKKGGDITCNTAHLMTDIPGNPDKNHWRQYEVWYMTCGLGWAIAAQDYNNINDKIFAIRTALKIIDIVCYDQPRAYFDSYFSCGFIRQLVWLRAENGMLNDTIYDDIEAMILSAKRADTDPIGKHYFDGNIFMNTVWYNHDLPNCEMKWAKETLEENCFDSIRENKRFQELYKMLLE